MPSLLRRPISAEMRIDLARHESRCYNTPVSVVTLAAMVVAYIMLLSQSIEPGQSTEENPCGTRADLLLKGEIFLDGSGRLGPAA
jgi:hypothetical protein